MNPVENFSGLSKARKHPYKHSTNEKHSLPYEFALWFYHCTPNGIGAGDLEGSAVNSQENSGKSQFASIGDEFGTSQFVDREGKRLRNKIWRTRDQQINSPEWQKRSRSSVEFKTNIVECLWKEPFQTWGVCEGEGQFVVTNCRHKERRILKRRKGRL